MYQPANEQLIDCISAKELLQALNTLQQISTEATNELQLSFSKSSHSLFNTVDNKSHMDFLMYMELKNGSKNQKPNMKKPRQKYEKQTMNALKNQVGNRQTRKSISPALEHAQKRSPLQQISIHKKNMGINKEKQQGKSPGSTIKQFKSRSHSPLNNAQNHHSHQKSTFQVKKQGKVDFDTSHIKTEFLSKRGKQNGIQKEAGKNKQNKQNRDMIESTKQVAVKVSDHSKKIMMERQRKGKAYVPIQERTSQLIRQKQQKIAKLQRASLAQKQIQQRECTFKPSINVKKPQKIGHTRAHTTLEQPQGGQTCQATRWEPECSGISNTKRQKKEKEVSCEGSDIEMQTLRKERKKNIDKFEILLDFI